MQGKKKEILSSSYILSRINDWSVYKHYLPGIGMGKKVKSPFRDDHTPSFDLSSKDGKIYYRDWGDSEYRGDCFKFVQQLFGLNYDEALKKIAFDFGLGGENIKAKILSLPEGMEEREMKIQVEIKRFLKVHKQYWEQYSLSVEDLQCLPDTHVYAVNSWAVNHSKMPMDKEELVFAYYVQAIDRVKIYMPHRKKGDKWRSSIPYDYIMGIDNMKDCDVGIVTKSVKDAAVLCKYISPCVCSVQGEDIAAVSPENVKRITESCKNVYVAWDSDSTGVRACTELTNLTGWGYINPPNRLLEHGVTDFADMCKIYGPQSVIEFFKLKGII